jgi:cytochrome c oxidase subunit 1
MSTNAIAIENLQSAAQPWMETLHEWVTTVDHKRLGILYIVYALGYLVIAGVEALIIRVQLMHAHNNFVSPQVFNRMFTMHGTTMIFFVAMPILFGFANYLVPLMIGARDMAFPRLNAFSFWLTALGGLLLYFSFLGGNGLYGAGTARRRSHQATARIIGPSLCWSRDSAASVPPSISSLPFYACDAPECTSAACPCWSGSTW